jgi:hypothetical protein
MRGARPIGDRREHHPLVKLELEPAWMWSPLNRLVCGTMPAPRSPRVLWHQASGAQMDGPRPSCRHDAATPANSYRCDMADRHRRCMSRGPV